MNPKFRFGTTLIIIFYHFSLLHFIHDHTKRKNSSSFSKTYRTGSSVYYMPENTPYIRLHHLTLTDNGIRFLGGDFILYTNILDLRETKEGLHIILKTGWVYFLSHNENKHFCCEVYQK